MPSGLPVSSLSPYQYRQSPQKAATETSTMASAAANLAGYVGTPAPSLILGPNENDKQINCIKDLIRQNFECSPKKHNILNLSKEDYINRAQNAAKQAKPRLNVTVEELSTEWEELNLWQTWLNGFTDNKRNNYIYLTTPALDPNENICIGYLARFLCFKSVKTIQVDVDTPDALTEAQQFVLNELKEHCDKDVSIVYERIQTTS